MSQSETKEILEAIGVFSNTVEKRFNALEGRVTIMELRMATKDDLAAVEQRMNEKFASQTKYYG